MIEGFAFGKQQEKRSKIHLKKGDQVVLINEFDRRRNEPFDIIKEEHIDFIQKLDVIRHERIALDTNKVAVKIIDALNKNTQKAIDELKG